MGALTGRRVLVIGRGSGIARAVALAAKAEGALVVVAGRDAAKLSDAYRDEDVTVETIDVTDENSIAALAQRLGSVDHLVTTASARARGRVADLTPETVALSFATKAIGPILLAKHFAPTMPKDGSIVLSSGSTATRPSIGMLAVAGTNGAVDSITKALAIELAPIRVNAVSPGTIDTGAYDGLGDQAKSELFQKRIAANPARRVGTSENVAGAVIFALTATYVTGAILPVDGGETLV